MNCRVIVEAAVPVYDVDSADEALVALELEMTVFNVEDEEHAARIARKEIGQRMRNIPLEVLRVEEHEEEDEETETEASSEEDTTADDESGSEDVLPEFEDLVEE